MQCCEKGTRVRCRRPNSDVLADAPCLPTKTTKLPSSSEWLHEIVHDGFRIIARKDRKPVRGAQPTLAALQPVQFLPAKPVLFVQQIRFISISCIKSY